MDRHEVKSNQRSCWDPGAVAWTVLTVLKHIKEKITTLSEKPQHDSWAPLHPRPGCSREERKMWRLWSIIPKKYTHYEREWEIHIPDPSVKPWCFDPGLFVWLWDARGVRRDWQVYSLGVCGTVGKVRCLLCKEPPPESPRNKEVAVWQLRGSFPLTLWAFVITTKEHTSRLSP